MEVSLGSFLVHDIELILKTIIGPIVVGVVLRLVDKWPKQGQIVSKKTSSLFGRELGVFSSL